MGSKDRFAVRLKQLREAAGLTQQQLADKAGIKLGGLRDLEQAKNGPTWDTVLALAAALGVTCEAFTAEPSAEALEPRKPGRPRKQAEDQGEGPAAEAPAEEPPAKKKPGRRKGKGS